MPRIDDIRLRRGTLAEWQAANPVLNPGEVGLITDLRSFVVGDGANAFNLLINWSDFGSNGIKTDSIAESTSAAGVTVDGVLLKDGDIYPTGDTNGLAARFELLFGDDVPGASYTLTQRNFLINSGANQLGFEDSQASPYAPPGGSSFSINLAGNATAKSNLAASWLDLFSVTTGAGSYLQWANATTKTTYQIIVALKTVRRTVDTYLGEIRFWNAASFATGPQSTDTWSAIRFNYYAATYPDNPIRIEHYYSTAGTDGVTFALATGTLAASFPYFQGFPFVIAVSIVPYGGNGALTARISPVDAPPPGINSFGVAAAGLPDQFNYARLYVGQSNQFGYLVDQVVVS